MTIPHLSLCLLEPSLHIWLPGSNYGHSILVASVEVPQCPAELSSLLTPVLVC